MNLRVTLAGHNATWRFRDSDRLDEWLAGQPWWQGGGVRILRIAGPEQEEAMLAALPRTIRAADHHGDVSVRRLSASSLAGGLRNAVAGELSLRPGLSVRDFLAEISLELRTPTVFLAGLNPAKGINPSREATALREDVLRTADGAAFTVLLLDTHERPLAGDSDDLTVGRPVDDLLSRTATADAPPWRGYVHYRLAWECGGDLLRAARLDDRAFAELGLGADDSLEGILNDAAACWFADLPSGVTLLAEEYLKDLAGEERDRAWRDEAIERLSSAGVLWKPPGQQAWRPAPWAARALLLLGRSTGARSLLRGCLVCPYLAHDLLVRCFDLEAQERSRSTPPDAPTLVSHWQRSTWEEAVNRQSRFEGGEPASARCYYPRDCPALPIDPWDFASFGEYFGLLPRDGTRASPRELIKGVRNALSHGHYVSWAMIRDLLRAQERLAW